jgi:carotenoid cleavage dioxygenase-like enzyme
MTAPSTHGLSAAAYDGPAPAYLLGFQTLDAEISLPTLPMQGNIPNWLTGTLLRMGPARFEWGPDRYRHWFDGSGMIHKFSFAAGKVGYANRYVRGSSFAENERAGRITAQTFATDPCQELFRKGFVHYHVTGNPSVNVITAGDMIMALGEAALPIAVDPHTLETRGEWPWRDDILLGADGKLRPQHTTPHPHFDRVTGDLINNVEIFARECRYELHRGPRDGKRTRFAVVPVERPAYMHTFGMSENYVVLAEYPLVADVQTLAVRKRPFIENYEWLPERGTIFTVVSKADGTVVARAQGEPFLGIHQINCFERDASVVFDVPAYPRVATSPTCISTAGPRPRPWKGVRSGALPCRSTARTQPARFCLTSSPSCPRSTTRVTLVWTTRSHMPQADAKTGRRASTINCCVSTSGEMMYDAGSRTAVTQASRYSCQVQPAKIAIRASFSRLCSTVCANDRSC